MFRTRTPADDADSSLRTLADIGRRLREARESSGRPIDVYASSLCIRPDYLNALEDGDFGAVPGRVYALGFLRSYAGLLSLDAEALVQEARETVDRGQVWRGEQRVVAPAASAGFPRAAIAALSVLLVATGVSAWLYGQEDAPAPAPVPLPMATAPAPVQPASPPVPVATAPTETALAPSEMVTASGPADATGPVPQPIDAPSAPAASPGPSGTAETAQQSTTPSPPAASLPGSGSTELAGTPSDAPQLAAPAGDAGSAGMPSPGNDLLPLATASGPLAVPDAPQATEMTGRIVLEAREPSWIQVRSPGRDFVHSGTLEAGDRFVVPDRTDLALWTGNAGGLVVYVDGRPVAPLGTSGAVLRDVALDPTQLEGRVRATP